MGCSGSQYAGLYTAMDYSGRWCRYIAYIYQPKKILLDIKMTMQQVLHALASRFQGIRDRNVCMCMCAMVTPLIARFIGPTWGPSRVDRTQVGPMLAPLTLLSGTFVQLGLKPQ